MDDRIKPQSTDEYLATLGDEQRSALETLRGAIGAAVPEAEECISYQQPAWRLDGRPLVAMGAARKHCSFYLMSTTVLDGFGDEIAAYDTSKGTIRFATDRPLPPALVERLVRARVAEHGGGGRKTR